MSKHLHDIEHIISKKVENLLRSNALQGSVDINTIHMSPPEFNQKLSYLRLTVDELKKIVNNSSSDIEIERPACHRIAIHLDKRGDE